jgi:hypothetical protein
MRVRFAALALTFGMAAVGLLTAGAQAGYAGIVATTGSATSVTSTSAIVNGVALTINPSSAWVFQYGTSSSYGQYSHGSTVGLGLTAVSEKVTNLTPNTTYHFRLVVIQGDPGNANDYSMGDDVTFTTPPPAPTYATTLVQSRRLAVTKGVTSIRFVCNGGRGSMCQGEIALVAREKGGRLVNCGRGALVARAGDGQLIESRLDWECARLLNEAPGHTVNGEVRVTLAGTQRLVRGFVTFVGSAASNGDRATGSSANTNSGRKHHADTHRSRRHHQRRRHG